MLKFLTFCFLTVGLVNGFGGMSLPGTEEPEGCCCADAVLSSVTASACSSVSMAALADVAAKAEAASTAELVVTAKAMSIARAIALAEANATTIANARAHVQLQANTLLTAISTAFGHITDSGEYSKAMTVALTAVSMMSEGHVDATMYGEATALVTAAIEDYQMSCDEAYAKVVEFHNVTEICSKITEIEAELSVAELENAVLSTVSCGADEEILNKLGISTESLTNTAY